MNNIKILNRIDSYKEYSKKIKDYEDHIVKLMIGKKGQPIPLHVMVVSGDKGVGKSYTADKILSNQSIRKYVMVNSSLSAVELYKLMWNNNDAIIVLDDVNSILQDTKDGASLLKACTDTKNVRVLNWQKQNHCCIPVSKFNLKSNREIEDKMNLLASMNKKLNTLNLSGKTFPDQFFFTGALIILTNKPLSCIDKITEGAVSNRGWHQEMLFTVDGAIDMLKKSSHKMTSFNDIKLKKSSISKALSFLTSKSAVSYYKNNEKLPTLRTLGKVAIECEFGNKLDTDTLINNTESPAY